MSGAKDSDEHNEANDIMKIFVAGCLVNKGKGDWLKNYYCQDDALNSTSYDHRNISVEEAMEDCMNACAERTNIAKKLKAPECNYVNLDYSGEYPDNVPHTCKMFQLCSMENVASKERNKNINQTRMFLSMERNYTSA
jgi:hypothetical protein